MNVAQDEKGQNSKDLINFVKTTGSRVSVGQRDRGERILETMSDLGVVISGIAHGPKTGNLSKQMAVLARACSIFLRKMVIGERNGKNSRLLNDDFCRTVGISFHKIRKIINHRTLDLRLGIDGGYFRLTKLDDITRQPEADTILQIPPQSFEIFIEWPLPGMTSWTNQPTPEDPWKITSDELFDLESSKRFDCDGWLGQQLVLFDNRGVSLQEVLKITADTEGAHSSFVSSLSQVEGERKRAVQNAHLHILSNVTICGMKYNHIIVVEAALYLYSKLIDNESINRPDGEWYLPTFCVAPGDVFSSQRKWLTFDGGFTISFGGGEQDIRHRIRGTK